MQEIPETKFQTIPPRILLGPGPMMVPPRVLQAMVNPMIGYLAVSYTHLRAHET